MAGGADEYQQNKEGKCRHCYQKKSPLKKLFYHILNQHKNKLSQEIEEINETSNSVPAAETNRSKPDECRFASSNTSTESSTPTPISESSNVTTLERNENPEDHFDAFPYEAIPARISDYVNKNQRISPPKLQSQESSDVPPTELPASSSSQDS
uniref:Uncharacterized protein n=1 Tax=Panagrolaimus davidi TaxID=227884 RepID=A0A914QRX9_9BILA